MCEPLMASAVAWSILNEQLALVQIIGGFVVLAGIVLAELSRSPSRPR
jgi:drug/metabolite transporter (DMT)-like permease